MVWKTIEAAYSLMPALEAPMISEAEAYTDDEDEGSLDYIHGVGP